MRNPARAQLWRAPGRDPWRSPARMRRRGGDVRHRYLRRISMLAALAATVAMSPELAAGQVPPSAARTSAPAGRQTMPRTPWGDPDLRGRWTNTTTTPLERPNDLAGEQGLTA